MKVINLSIFFLGFFSVSWTFISLLDVSFADCLEREDDEGLDDRVDRELIRGIVDLAVRVDPEDNDPLDPPECASPTSNVSSRARLPGSCFVSLQFCAKKNMK